MNTSACEWCGTEVNRRGTKPARFCSRKCKGEWQRTQKPVDEAWLRQKYLVEGLGSYQIAKLVKRNPKQVHEWLKGYGIPLRRRTWDIEATGKPHQTEEWLRREYAENQRSAANIAQECGVTENNVFFFLKKFGIPRRDMTTIRGMKHWGAEGEDNPMYGKRGPENPHYIDGSSPERQRTYARFEWKELLRSIYARDNYRCARCGDNGRNGFHAHHLKPWAGNPALRSDPDNLITLCPTCHRWVHSKKNTEREYLR